MAIETLYYRSDTHTINGLSANKLITSQTGISQFYGGTLGQATCTPFTWSSSVYVRHSNSTNTTLGTTIASVARHHFFGDYVNQGYQTGTWSCPLTVLATDDALYVQEKLVPAGNPTKDFITAQLGWTKLNAITWSFKRYTYQDVKFTPSAHFYYRMYYDNTYDSKIFNIDYISYLDIGLRMRTSSETIKIGVYSLDSSHKLRIRKGGTTYGIPLLSTGDSNASGVRIYDGTTVKALPKIT